MSLVINKHKIYNYEERAYESLGNILSIKTTSFKLYCKLFWKIPRYSYLLSYRCLSFLMQEKKDEILKATDILKIKNNKFILNFFFDMLTLDEHLNDMILNKND